MGNVTQCPRCATQFRVVPDQLKISDGWVRCGQCSEVFDARVAMVPLPDPESAGPVSLPGAIPPSASGEALSLAGDTTNGLVRFEDREPADTAVVPVPPDPVVEVLHTGAESEGLDVPLSPAEAHAPLGDAVRGDPGAADAWMALPVSEVVASPTVNSPAVVTADEANSALPSVVLDDSSSLVAGDAAVRPALDPLPDPAEPDVSFVRQARRQAFWARGGVRALLGLVGAVLLLLLVGQWAVHHRDRLIAQYPQLQPLLQAACEPLDCRLEAWRNIDAVVIEGSALVLMPSGNYRFEVNLKNTSALPVAMPAVELSLTNARDEVVLRRVVASGEWPVAPPVLAGRAEQALTVELSITQPGELGMSGYRVLAFYP